MRQTKHKYKWNHIKNKGVSLPVAFVTSMFVLVLALYTLNSITRSYQRTVGIERSNKVFFASESGVEAALFHKNARQTGAHFNYEEWNSADTSYTDWMRSVRLNHSDTGSEARWKLESRFKPTPTNLVFNGELKEFQAIEIPLFYDESLRTTDSPSINNDLKGETITLSFPGDVVPSSFDFGDSRPIVTPPNVFDPATQKRERLLVDWSISRFHDTNGVQTFIPETDLGNPCFKDDTGTNRSELLCESEVSSGSDKNIVLNSSTITGAVEPCADASGTGCHLVTNLQQFFSTAGNISEFKLRIQALLPFEDSDSTGAGSKINTIPFTVRLQDENTDLPETKYTITSTVFQGDYIKETSFTVDEASGIGAFNYVIFE